MKNFIKIIVLFFFCTSMAMAAQLQCIITASKDPSWGQHNVTVEMLDFATKKVIASFALTAADPSHKKLSVNSMSQSFNCEKYKVFQFRASYTPVVWSSNKDKVYPSDKVIDLTQQLQTLPAGTAKLETAIKFPQDFIGVPALIEG